MSKAFLAVAAAAVVLASPALTQKSADTIRIVINDTFAVLDDYRFASDEAGACDRIIYQPLITCDEHKKQWVNVLASGHERIDERPASPSFARTPYSTTATHALDSRQRHTGAYLCCAKNEGLTA